MNDVLAQLMSHSDRRQQFHHVAPQRMEQHFDLVTQTALLENLYSGIMGTK